MKALLRRFWTDEQGLETVEWAILGALIAGATVTVVIAMGGNITTVFTRMQGATAQSAAAN